MFRHIFSLVLLRLSVGDIIFNNEYARAISGNSSHMILKYFTFNKYNRTAKAANVEFELLDKNPYDRENDIDILFSFSIFKSNEYKKTPIVFPGKLCRILGSKKFDLPNITSNSTLKNCPIHKGHHHLYNIMLTSNGWPVSLPTGRYLLELRFFYKKDLLIIVEWMLEISAVQLQ